MSENPPLYNQFTVAGDRGRRQLRRRVPFPRTSRVTYYDCETAANTAFQTAFTSGSNVVARTRISSRRRTISITAIPEVEPGDSKGLGSNTRIDVSYFGNHGIHEPIVNTGFNAFGFGSLPAVVAPNQFAEITLVESAGISNYNGLTRHSIIALPPGRSERFR